MRIDVIFSNNFDSFQKHIDISNCICGVIDVIRATTTMSVLLAKKCKEIIISKSKSRSFFYKKIFKDYLICGEEQGWPPKGFDYGNSPIEFMKLPIENKGIILKTTNGTKSFFKTLNSKGAFVVSLINIRYACEVILKEALDKNCNILLICSGEKGKISYDDTYTAGMAVKILIEELNCKFEISDGAKVALAVANFEKDPSIALKRSSSYYSMLKVGLGPDVDLCSKLSIFEVTGKLFKYNNEKEIEFLINNNQEINSSKISIKKSNIKNISDYFPIYCIRIV